MTCSSSSIWRTDDPTDAEAWTSVSRINLNESPWTVGAEEYVRVEDPYLYMDANGRWHVLVPMIDKGVSKVLIGIYDDEFVRTPDGWRFQRLRFTPAGIVDLPAGWQVS